MGKFTNKRVFLQGLYYTTKRVMSFIYSRTIHLADTDAAGVIYFAKALAICHEAYEHYLISQAIALKEIAASQGIAIPIVHSSADFFQPIFWGDRLSVTLMSAPPRQHSFELAYTIGRAEGGYSTAISAQTRHVCIDRQTRHKVPLPAALADAIAALNHP
jgi:1,4-dihydroxy-2-naphthoyl-CoA hydrolase